MDNTIRLTDREIQVILLTAQGYTKAEIAKILFVTVHTVKAHIESVYLKLNVHNKMQAIIYVLKLGLIKLENL